MSITLFIIFVTLAQLLFYTILDRKKHNKWKLLLLILIIIAYNLVFPRFFFSDDKSCGMGFFAFFVFGSTCAIFTHIVYLIVKKIALKYKAHFHENI